MTFEEKVQFLRTLPQFKVIPISEVRAIAFAAKASGPGENSSSLTLTNQTSQTSLTLTPDDIQKITRAYPDLKTPLA